MLGLQEDFILISLVTGIYLVPIVQSIQESNKSQMEVIYIIIIKIIGNKFIRTNYM